jgi:hypothetical protein
MPSFQRAPQVTASNKKALRFTLLQRTGQGHTQTTIDGYQLISLPVLQIAPISELALEVLGLRSLS